MGGKGKINGWCLLIGIALAIPFLVVLCFVLLFVAGLDQVAKAESPALQTQAYEWMMDIPQNSDYISDAVAGSGVGSYGNYGPVVAGASNVPWEDYSDPATANITGTPVRNKPVPDVNCIFGMQPGYSMTPTGFHPGVDWPVPEGSPVYTIMGGEVIFADFNASPLEVEKPPESNYAPASWLGKTVSEWGGLVVVQNGNFQVWYAHMEILKVSVGQIVNSGDVVGLSDSLGNSSGPHVHLGVKMKSGDTYEWVDPLKLQGYGFTGITPDMWHKIVCK
jgi:murein DD-endopeptidase MepM/ murein hydrolase activator NlpD